MKTLIIYDNTGYIYSQMSGTYTPPQGGVQYLEVEIPDGKYAKSVDVSVIPNVPVYEDVPKSEVKLLKEQLLATQAQLANVQEQLLLK